MNPGQRCVAVYRYGPNWGRLRYPFKISEAMLARLTPERRTIIEPQPQSLVPPGAAARGRTTQQQKKTDSRAVLVYADARCRCAGLVETGR